MSTSTASRIWTCKALTDIWTGDADRKGERLITTGLLGSIRWWYEVVARGLGGTACDPSNSHNRCPQDSRKKPDDPGHHCVVCELFGCTGWARKFRFQVLDENSNIKQNQIKQGHVFKLQFHTLRPVRDEEWALLDLTLRLIAHYGAIGGRTVFKPTDEQNRQNTLHHKDYGLIQLEGTDPALLVKTEKELRSYVQDPRWRRVDHDDFAWASLHNFWCVKGRYLARQDASSSTFNRVIERPEPKTQAANGDSWLAGQGPDQNKNIDPASKKVFSFKEPEDTRRTFGFVRPNLINFDAMKGRLKDKGVWPAIGDSEFLKGEDILTRLLSGTGGGTA